MPFDELITMLRMSMVESMVVPIERFDPFFANYHAQVASLEALIYAFCELY